MSRIEDVYRAKVKDALERNDDLAAMTLFGIDTDRAKDVAKIGLIPEVWASAFEAVTSGKFQELNQDEVERVSHDISGLMEYLNNKQREIEGYVATLEQTGDFFAALKFLSEFKAAYEQE